MNNQISGRTPSMVKLTPRPLETPVITYEGIFNQFRTMQVYNCLFRDFEVKSDLWEAFTYTSFETYDYYSTTFNHTQFLISRLPSLANS